MAEQKKISKNILYSIIIQITGFIAPLITSPYIARVLSAETIGDYSYTLANSTYFALVECLGLALYGTLKVAQVRDDKRKLTKLFSEIFILKIILMILSILVYCLLFFVLGGKYHILYLIMLFNLISSGIDVTWFLCGVEEFKITAIRSIFVRSINIVLILLLVKSPKDLYIYAIIMQASTLLGNCIMFPTVFKHVEKIQLKKIKCFQHVLPSLVYLVPGVVNTIFSSTDKSILGKISNSKEVGLYEQANKICQLCMGMISAISNAIFPRIAYLSSKDKSGNESKKLLNESVRIAMLAALPICFGICAISDSFVPVFFGEGYDKSAFLLKILCFNVLFTSLCNFIGQQCLIAKGKQKEYNIGISISASVNVVLNLILVRKYSSVGVSVASVFGAFIGLIILLCYASSVIKAREIFYISKKYILAAIIMYISIYRLYIYNNFITVFFQMLLGGCLYLVSLLIIKDTLIYKFINKLRHKI